jgi:SAM-dependent methyltransferase
MTDPKLLDVDYHRRYFIGPNRATRIALGMTPSVRRHVAQTIDPLHLTPGARVLELGCGLGRFTEALLARGHLVTAMDLSDYLIDRLRASFGQEKGLETVVGRAEEVDRLTRGSFDAVVGFFFLHHIIDFRSVFEATRRVLAPGGRIAFCEPNAFNPLFYVQMTVTPGMSWKGEPSVSKMRPGFLFPMLAELGFIDIESSLYGMFPPAIANTAVGRGVERGLEAIPPLRPLSAFRIIRARLP